MRRANQFSDRVPSAKDAPSQNAAGGTPAGMEPFPVLLAVGNGATRAIVRVTHALAQECGAQPTIFHALEVGMYPMSDALPELVIGMEAVRGSDFVSDRAKAIRHRVAAEDPTAVSWPIEIGIGDATSSVIQHARGIDARLIIMGLRTIGTIEHIVSDDIVYDVMKSNVAPVLAVHPSLEHRPMNILVAVDFSEASIRAARLAARLIDPRGILRLVYAQPDPLADTSEAGEGKHRLHERGVRASFSQLQAELTQPGLSVETVTLTGEPRDALITFAELTHPDCIAIGSQRHSIAHRLFVGSLTHAIVREARWSMLVVPPPLAAEDDVA